MFCSGMKRCLMTAAATLTVMALGVAPARAALILDFENLEADGGTVTPLGGGNYSGTNILFQEIYLVDTVTNVRLAGVQCGLTVAGSCLLNFNTLTGTFVLTDPGGLYNIGPDLIAYTADTGALVLAAGQNVLTGTGFTSFGEIGLIFGANGTDTKNETLLRFFGLASSQFIFANTEILVNAQGEVQEADLTNRAAVPEPTALSLFGLGFLAVGRAFRRRRNSTSA
jgi:hypothetical protein